MKIAGIVLFALLALEAYPATSQDIATSTADSQPAASAVQGPSLAVRAPRYRIRASDSMDLVFALSPEFNQAVTVQPDGYIALQSAGTILAQGLTVPELAKAITRAYAGILHDPVVTIELKDFDKPYFIAEGQVIKPGKYDLRSDLTLTQGVAIAGGFNERAKHSQVVLFRQLPDGSYHARVVNVKKLLAARNLNEDIPLRPGDVLYVPQSRFSRIRPYIPSTTMGAYMGTQAY